MNTILIRIIYVNFQNSDSSGFKLTCFLDCLVPRKFPSQTSYPASARMKPVKYNIICHLISLNMKPRWKNLTEIVGLDSKKTNLALPGERVHLFWKMYCNKFLQKYHKNHLNLTMNCTVCFSNCYKHWFYLSFYFEKFSRNPVKFQDLSSTKFMLTNTFWFIVNWKEVNWYLI